MFKGHTKDPRTGTRLPDRRWLGRMFKLISYSTSPRESPNAFEGPRRLTTSEPTYLRHQQTRSRHQDCPRTLDFPFHFLK